MSKYKKINFDEIENSSRTEGNEMLFSRKFLDSTELGVTLIRVAPNTKAPKAHSHKMQEEAYAVIKGSGSVLLDEEVVELKQWDVIRVAPEVARAFAAGPEGLEIIAVGGHKPADGDGVMRDALWP